MCSAVIVGGKLQKSIKICCSVGSDPIFTLIDYWNRAFKKRYRIDYQYGTESSRYDNLTDLYISLSRDLGRTIKAIDIFLNDENLEWVNNKTLPWLCKASNLVFIIPHLNKKLASKKGPNWTSSRGMTYKVVAV